MNLNYKHNITWNLKHPVSHERALLDAHPPAEPVRFKKAKRDEGIIEYPRLRCDLSSYIFPKEDKVLIVSENTGGKILSGRAYKYLIPLMDGKKSTDEIIETLKAKKIDDQTVRILICRLSSQNTIVSAQYNLSSTQALYWCHQGVSPALAEEYLKKCPLHIHAPLNPSLEQTLRKSLKDWFGWQFVKNEKNAEIVIHVVDTYLRKDLAGVNQKQIERQQKWMLFRPGRHMTFVGPLFRPNNASKEKGPCWECLRHRLNGGTLSLSPFLESQFDQCGPFAQTAKSETWNEHAAISLFCSELNLYLLKEERAPINSHLVASLPQENTGYHWLGQHPYCKACGKRPPAKPAIVQLQSGSLDFVTEGGMRTKSPEETFSRYKKYVGPLIGIVSEVSVYSKDDWFFSALSGENHATTQKHLEGLKSDFRQTSGGKGASSLQAATGAICESLERYSGIFTGREEITEYRRFQDFKENEAIAPNDIMLFSENQYRHRQKINKKKDTFYQIPAPFDPTVEVAWTPVWSLTQKRFKYVMTDQLYYRKDKLAEGYKEAPFVFSDSNGCAAGTSPEDACLQALYELIERDAFAMWWYNRLSPSGVDLASFELPYIEQAVTFYERQNVYLWLIDLDNDWGIPTFVALAKNNDPQKNPCIIPGIGTHTNAAIAATRAISELNQMMLCAFNGWLENNSSEELVKWVVQADPQKDDFYQFLIPDKNRPHKKKQDYLRADLKDPLEEIERIRAMIEGKGMEMLLLDQTRQDVGLPVVKVLVPGMRHFWCRLAPGRLYDVPVEMGLLARKNREEDLNPIPFFL